MPADVSHPSNSTREPHAREHLRPRETGEARVEGSRATRAKRHVRPARQVSNRHKGKGYKRLKDRKPSEQTRAKSRGSPQWTPSLRNKVCAWRLVFGARVLASNLASSFSWGSRTDPAPHFPSTSLSASAVSRHRKCVASSSMNSRTGRAFSERYFTILEASKSSTRASRLLCCCIVPMLCSPVDRRARSCLCGSSATISTR